VRLRPDLRVLAIVATLCAAPLSATTQSPTDAQIDRAAQIVKADPDIANQVTIRRIGWDDETRKDRPREKGKLPAWMRWIVDLFEWIAESSRMLLIVVLAALAALLVTFIVRVFVSNRGPGARSRAFVAPTHVQDLDIRPESLPADIGAAARALWDRGEQRAALALLYRGLLSRLAHVHEVPIRDSSTEGDCLRLASRVLDAGRTAYVTQLVRTWQRAIYGGLGTEPAVMHELCAGFAPSLDASAPTDAPRRIGLAPGAA